jgi:hypothetical protein
METSVLKGSYSIREKTNLNEDSRKFSNFTLLRIILVVEVFNFKVVFYAFLEHMKLVDLTLVNRLLSAYQKAALLVVSLLVGRAQLEPEPQLMVELSLQEPFEKFGLKWSIKLSS